MSHSRNDREADATSDLIADSDELRKRILLSDNDIRAYELTMRIQMNLRIVADCESKNFMDELERLV